MNNPLVSIIVRSMGRPELRAALDSVAGQDYPNIEIVVVDATGGRHPPLPDIPWRSGHKVRMVGGTKRLPRPMACNVGLDAVTGQWFGFLDDDDTYLPHHVSTLVDATCRNQGTLLVYGLSNMLGSSGEIERVFGSPFNRAAMYYGPLFYWQASLISSRVRDLGCRFDEELDVCEDRDFLNQIAEHADFTFVPIVTFNYRPDAGTSGTGRGPNRNTARLHYFEGLLRAKWAGQREYHTTKVMQGVRDAILAYHGGEIEESRRQLIQVLREYPDDPSALHAVARLDLEAGRFAQAEAGLQRAMEILPAVAEFNSTLALVLFELGRYDDARRAALVAAQDPQFHPAMQGLLARLPGTEPVPSSRFRTATPSRNQACSCGSGKRYKHCCGSSTGKTVATLVSFTASADQQLVAEAASQLEIGGVDTVRTILDEINPGEIVSADAACKAARICRDLGDLRRERAFLARALELDEQVSTVGQFDRCVDEIFTGITRESLRRTLETLTSSIRLRAASVEVPVANASQEAEFHVLCDLASTGGSEHRALGIYRFLAGLGRSRLWSKSTPGLSTPGHSREVSVLDLTQGRKPRGGTLIVVGNYFDLDAFADLVEDCRRLVFCINVPEICHLKRLVSWLVMVEKSGRGHVIDFVFPSRMWRHRVGLDGFVEYAPIDMHRFSHAARFSDGSRLTVGRLCGNDKSKFHPGDPALIRQFVARGHRCRIMDGTLLTRALHDDLQTGAIELLPLDAEDAPTFLGSLDVFVYWKHPLLIETGGTVVIEAMAMEIPVIVIGEGVGVAELIEDGKDGFLAANEAEALEQLDCLAASRELRRAMGKAARAKVIATLERQVAEMRTFYTGNRVADAEACP